MKEATTPMMLQFDLDKDGSEEIMVWDHDMGYCLSPSRGGGMFDLCFIPARLNISDTLTRRQEAYHRKINGVNSVRNDKKEEISSIHDLSHQKDADLEHYLIRDRYTRISLLDHFIGNETTLKNYQASDYPEEGDFVERKYIIDQKEIVNGKALVELSAKGEVNGNPFKIKKRVEKSSDAKLTINYLLEDIGPKAVTSRFGCEFNLTLYSHTDSKRYLLFPENDQKREASETGEEKNIKTFYFVNEADGVKVKYIFSYPVTVWFYPLITVSQSEEGCEKSYQGTSLLFIHPFSIVPGQRIDFKVITQLIKITD